MKTALAIISTLEECNLDLRLLQVEPEFNSNKDEKMLLVLHHISMAMKNLCDMEVENEDND